MIKKSILTLGLIAACVAAHAEGLVQPQFGDFRIVITKEGKTIYLANALIGPGGSAVEDTVRTIPMQAKCNANTTISPALTYKQGVKLELNANVHQGVSYGYFAFEVQTPSSEAPEAPFGVGCKVRMVQGHAISSSGGKFLRVGESDVTRIDDLEVKVTLMAAFDALPAGRAVGKFTHN